MTTQQVPLQSTFLRTAEYDDETQRLEIVFANGQNYTFERVPQNVFEGLRDAGSAGQYYHANIKGRY